MSWDVESFREKLESQHRFPGNYSFKFIVPHEKQQEVMNILPKQGSQTSFRESSNGKYVSITSVSTLNSSQEVLDVYMEANKIEGCIAL